MEVKTVTEEYTARPTIGRFVKTGVGDYFARLKYYDSEHRAILLLLVLCLFNIFTSVIATFAVGIYLLTRRDIAADIFRTGGNGLLFGFLALSVTLSAINCNIVGILACVFVFFIFIIALYIMQNITPRFFEDMISTFLGYSVFATAYAAVEYIIGRLGDEYRASSTLANPLYFSYFLTFAVLFCTYRIVTVKRYRRLYVPLLVINAFGMILSGGRMPWIGMFIGLFVILLLRRKYKLLFVFGAFISLLLLCFVCFPDIKIFAGLRLN